MYRPKETPAQVFSCEFAKFLKTPFLQNSFGRLFNYFICNLLVNYKNLYSITQAFFDNTTEV